MKKLPPSSAPEENDPGYVGVWTCSAIKGFVVAAVATYPLLTVTSTEAGLYGSEQSTAVAGVLFVGYEVYDLIDGVCGGRMTPDYIVHHIIFISAGLLSVLPCYLWYYSATAMIQEWSTPLLSVNSIIRRRLGKTNKLVIIVDVSFAITFVLFRVINASYVFLGWWVLQIRHMFLEDGRML